MARPTHRTHPQSGAPRAERDGRGGAAAAFAGEARRQSGAAREIPQPLGGHRRGGSGDGGAFGAGELLFPEAAGSERPRFDGAGLQRQRNRRGAGRSAATGDGRRAAQ